MASEIEIPDTGTNTGMGIKFAPVGHPDAGQNLKAANSVSQRFNDKFYIVYPEKFAVLKAKPDPGWGKKDVSEDQVKKWLSEVK